MVRRALAPLRYTFVSLATKNSNAALRKFTCLRLLSGKRKIGCSADCCRRCGRVGQRQACSTPCASTGIKFCAACFCATQREGERLPPDLTHHNVAHPRRQARRLPRSGTRRNQRCATWTTCLRRAKLVRTMILLPWTLPPEGLLAPRLPPERVVAYWRTTALILYAQTVPSTKVLQR